MYYEIVGPKKSGVSESLIEKKVSVFNGIAIPVGYLTLKTSLWMWYYSIHIFPKSIRPKVNIIARLESELTYRDFAVQYVSYYATATHATFTLWSR